MNCPRLSSSRCGQMPGIIGVRNGGHDELHISREHATPHVALHERGVAWQSERVSKIAGINGAAATHGAAAGAVNHGPARAHGGADPMCSP